MKRLIRDEKGQAMILALLLLLVSGLMIAPLLSFMGTGLRTGEVYETRTEELYAADAGVEDAIWRIRDAGGNVSQSPFSVGKINDKDVVVSVRPDLDETRTQGCNTTRTRRFRVESIATGADGGTNVTAYVEYITVSVNYSGVKDQMITVQKDLSLPENRNELNDLISDIWANRDRIPCPTGCNCTQWCWKVYDYRVYDTIPPACRGCVAVYNYPSSAWPGADVLSAFYLRQVAGQLTYNGTTEIDLDGNNFPPGPIAVEVNKIRVPAPSQLGPLRVNGGLTIQSTRPQNHATLTLNGTLYITGDTLIEGPTSNEPYKLTIDLNGQTIFVNSTSQQALRILKCNVKGPGAIIAVGGIYFAPKAEAGANAPIFILSTNGTTVMQPSGSFHGAIAGQVDVELQPNAAITYPRDGFGTLNFPGLSPGPVVSENWGIVTWEAKPR